MFLVFWRKHAAILNLPKTSSTMTTARRYPPELIDLDYHTGHIVPVSRTAPPVPSRHTPNASPLPLHIMISSTMQPWEVFNHCDRLQQ